MTRNAKNTIVSGRLTEWLHSALGLHERETPFPWQELLLHRLLDGDIPGALDIPTGIGKTSVIPIWLVARAANSRVPRRLVYVVDRRAVVDQATTEAERLQKLVEENEPLARALGQQKLPISTLRGQFIDNRQWLEDPSTAAIVLGTVDMVGSRLLFSGYGVSPKMRPYHAGLLGSDTLVVLDEAHLVQPFERLMEQLATGRDANGCPLGPEDPTLQALVPRLRFLSLSATGRERNEGDVLRLSDADERHPIVRKRLTAAKRLVIRPEVAENALSEGLAVEAWGLSKDGTSPVRVIVFCTSRDQAQNVETLLRKRLPNPEDTELFVGGRRVFERNCAAKWLDDHGFLAGRAKKLERPAFVIATAAGEVGVDLDADHCACDLVAWERMVQRLGRVNRRGDGAAEIVVVPAASRDGKDTARVSAVRELLAVLPKVGDGVDVSPGALMGLRSKEASRALIVQATTPAPIHPPLTRALVEAWSMTSLEDHTGRPEVAPWVRGWPAEEEKPQTTVVWRTHLPVTDADEQGEAGANRARLLPKHDLGTFRDAADPHLAEQLEIETWRVLQWLGKRVNVLEALRPMEAGIDRLKRPLRATDVIGVILDARDGARVVQADDLTNRNKRDDVERALAGATLLVDRRLGGLRSGLLASDSGTEVDDLTELEDPRVVPFRIIRSSRDSPESTSTWRTEFEIPIRRSDEGVTERLIVESLIDQAAESEEGRSAAKRDQLLEEHQEWAEVEAKQIAERLELPRGYAELLAFSARRHDAGKQELRWQRAFRAPADGTYAKTKRAPDLKVLDGYRHELGSLPYAEAQERFKALPAELRELCLHLIAAHHGYARPIIRTSGAPEPPSRLVVRAREIALRFAALERRWGPWGLAWWEALLRSADQQASRLNDLDGGKRG